MKDKELSEMVKEVGILKARVKCLEEVDTLRDQQMNVLKQFIENYLMINIKPDGSHHGRKT